MKDCWGSFTRRGLLKAGGTIAAAAAIPVRASAAAAPPGKLMVTLSTYMAEAAVTRSCRTRCRKNPSR